MDIVQDAGGIEALRARFAKHCEKKAGGCWAWRGAKKNERGYGVMYFSERAVRATHVSLILSGRNRPSFGHGALHSCDNPNCVNPEHLRWGTQKENMVEASQRGRVNIEAARVNGKKSAGRRYSFCRFGHALTDDNRNKRGRCKACVKRHYVEYRVRHGLPTGAL